jgi:hypothetical protein
MNELANYIPGLAGSLDEAIKMINSFWELVAQIMF